MTIPDKDWEKIRELLLEHGKQEITRRINELKLEELALFTTAEVCGKLNIMPNVLSNMGIPRVDLTGNGSTFRYTLKAILEYIQKREEKKLKH